MMLLQTPEIWPQCVDWCWLRLPQPPEHTGLQPLVPMNTIPTGSHGKYVCRDPTLGVDKGSSPYFSVACINGSDYDVPEEDHLWPVCQPKTTTVSPGIGKLRNMSFLFCYDSEVIKLKKRKVFAYSVLPSVIEHFYCTLCFPVILIALSDMRSSANKRLEEKYQTHFDLMDEDFQYVDAEEWFDIVTIPAICGMMDHT